VAQTLFDPLILWLSLELVIHQTCTTARYTDEKLTSRYVSRAKSLAIVLRDPSLAARLGVHKFDEPPSKTSTEKCVCEHSS
jgi:hypothetical protein